MSLKISNVHGEKIGGSVIKVGGQPLVDIGKVSGRDVGNVIDLDEGVSGSIESVFGEDVKGDVIRISNAGKGDAASVSSLLEQLEDPEFRRAIEAMIKLMSSLDTEEKAKAAAEATVVGKFLKKHAVNAWDGLVSNLWRLGWEAIKQSF